jgi:hypothetical protein
MSLLTLPTPPTPAQARAARALALPRIIFTRLLRDWRDGIKTVWAAPTPADVITALGPSAAELFTRSAQLRAFLEAQQPGCTQIPHTPEAALIQPHTIHPDGTVTINSQPASTPPQPATSGAPAPSTTR